MIDIVRFALQHADSSVSLMVLRATNAGRVQEAIDKTRWLSPVVSWRSITDDDIPFAANGEYDLSYRDAWRLGGSRIVFDMPKAREIHRERLRALRAPVLAALDVEYQRADEDGDAARKRDVVARKRRLRDATSDPRIDAAMSVDELRALDVLT